MEYALATHYGSGTVRFALEPDALVVTREKKGTREVVPLADIAELNLRCDLAAAWMLRIVRRTGATLVVPARHFEGLGRFELRASDYRRFVVALHAAVRAANPSARFVAGSSVFHTLGLVFLACGALFAALVAGGMLLAHKPLPPGRVLGTIPLLGAVGLGFVRQGRSVTYGPEQLPAHLLPTEAR